MSGFCFRSQLRCSITGKAAIYNVKTRGKTKQNRTKSKTKQNKQNKKGKSVIYWKHEGECQFRDSLASTSNKYSLSKENTHSLLTCENFLRTAIHVRTRFDFYFSGLLIYSTYTGCMRSKQHNTRLWRKHKCTGIPGTPLGIWLTYGNVVL